MHEECPQCEGDRHGPRCDSSMDISQQTPFISSSIARWPNLDISGIGMDHICLPEYAEMLRGTSSGPSLKCGHCSVPFPDDGALSEHRAEYSHHLCHRGITQVAGCWDCSDKQYMDMTGREIGPGPIDWMEELIEHVPVLPGERPYALTRMESLLTTTDTCDLVKGYLEHLRKLEDLNKLLADAKQRITRSAKWSQRWLHFVILANFGIVAFDWFGPQHYFDWVNLLVGVFLISMQHLSAQRKK